MGKLNIAEKTTECVGIVQIEDCTNTNYKTKNISNHPILGTFFCIVSIIIIIGCVGFIVKIPVCKECCEKTPNVLFQKLYEMLHSFLEIDDLKTGGIALCLLLLIGISGFIAGTMDDVLCLLPFGKIMRNKINLKLPAIARFVPALILTIYFSILFISSEFFKEVEYEILSFSWIGNGYTAGMWFTQIFIELTLIAFLFLVIESFIRSGFFGLILRVPLLLFSNVALAIFASYFVAVGIIAFIGIILIIIVLLVGRNYLRSVH